MTGFHEWAADDGEPNFLHRRDGDPMMVAVVHGARRAGDRSRPCVSLLTGPANADVANVWGRMPPGSGILAHHVVTREAQSGEARGPRLVRAGRAP